MRNLLHNIILAFIPVFVAVDAIGILPIYLSLVNKLSVKKRNTVLLQSIITALLLAVLFVFLGQALFSFLGIQIYDFIIAGGVILFIIAIRDILLPENHRHIAADEVGIVPLGTPLIVGPAVLTTSLIIIRDYGIIATLLSLFLNVMLAGLLFYFSHAIFKVLGKAGTKALSKVTSLLLAAIAIMMVRKGILEIAKLF